MKIFSSLSELLPELPQLSSVVSPIDDPIDSSIELSTNSSIDSQHKRPLVLTLGMFDGVHLGHQQVLHRLKEKKETGKSCLITFKNHPLSVLYPKKFSPCLYDYSTKLALLENFSLDFVVGLTFTHDLAEKSFSAFLEEVRKFYPFSLLILGEDAVFGKSLTGTKKEVISFAKKAKFSVEYIPLLECEGRKVSSSWIRELVKEGNMKRVEKLLGRSFLPEAFRF
jgi:riboflavin kinase/FMN adenylyltransferase